MSTHEGRIPDEEGSYVDSELPDGERHVPEGEGSYIDSELPEDAVVADGQRHVEIDNNFDDEPAVTQARDGRETGEVPGSTGNAEPMSGSTHGGLDGGDPGVEE